MGKMFKNFKSKKRGAISTVVLFTILMFIVILMGVYAAITINEKSQLQSDMKIQEKCMPIKKKPTNRQILLTFCRCFTLFALHFFFFFFP